MRTAILHLHSTLAILVLLFLVFGIVRGFIGYLGNNQEVFGARDKRITLLTLIFAHTQLLFGLYLWFVRMSSWGWDMGMIMRESGMRFLGVEHFITMLLAIVLITVVRVKTKKATDVKKQYRVLLGGYSVAFLLILIRIPWDQWSILQ